MPDKNETYVMGRTYPFDPFFPGILKNVSPSHPHPFETEFLLPERVPSIISRRNSVEAYPMIDSAKFFDVFFINGSPFLVDNKGRVFTFFRKYSIENEVRELPKRKNESSKHSKIARHSDNSKNPQKSEISDREKKAKMARRLLGERIESLRKTREDGKLTLQDFRDLKAEIEGAYAFGKSNKKPDRKLTTVYHDRLVFPPSINFPKNGRYSNCQVRISTADIYSPVENPISGTQIEFYHPKLKDSMCISKDSDCKAVFSKVTVTNYTSTLSNYRDIVGNFAGKTCGVVFTLRSNSKIDPYRTFVWKPQSKLVFNLTITKNLKLTIKGSEPQFEKKTLSEIFDRRSLAGYRKELNKTYPFTYNKSSGKIEMVRSRDTIMGKKFRESTPNKVHRTIKFSKNFVDLSDVNAFRAYLQGNWSLDRQALKWMNREMCLWVLGMCKPVPKFTPEQMLKVKEGLTRFIKNKLNSEETYQLERDLDFFKRRALRNYFEIVSALHKLVMPRDVKIAEMLKYASKSVNFYPGNDPKKELTKILRKFPGRKKTAPPKKDILSDENILRTAKDIEKDNKKIEDISSKLVKKRQEIAKKSDPKTQDYLRVKLSFDDPVKDTSAYFSAMSALGKAKGVRAYTYSTYLFDQESSNKVTIDQNSELNLGGKVEIDNVTLKMRFRRSIEDETSTETVRYFHIPTTPFVICLREIETRTFPDMSLVHSKLAALKSHMDQYSNPPRKLLAKEYDLLQQKGALKTKTKIKRTVEALLPADSASKDPQLFNYMDSALNIIYKATLT